MTTRSPNDRSDPEDDPTGMRDLLRSLPDPGPMPDDVARSINAALEQEQARRAASPGGGNVSPLVGGARRRSVRWQRTVVSIGAAAAIAAVAVIGVTAVQNRQAPTTAAPTAAASGDQSLADKVVVENTGSNYTKAHLATQAAALTKRSGPTLPPAQVEKLGSMATSSGVLACMQSIGAGLLHDPDKITVDIARFQGKPAAVVVITKGAKSTAWVVSRTCSKGTPPLAGPTSVHT